MLDQQQQNELVYIMQTKPNNRSEKDYRTLSQYLSVIPFFNELNTKNQQVQKQVYRKMQLKHYKQKSTIYKHNEKVEHIYILLDGQVSYLVDVNEQVRISQIRRQSWLTDLQKIYESQIKEDGFNRQLEGIYQKLKGQNENQSYEKWNDQNDYMEQNGHIRQEEQKNKMIDPAQLTKSTRKQYVEGMKYQAIKQYNQDSKQQNVRYRVREVFESGDSFGCKQILEKKSQENAVCNKDSIVISIDVQMYQKLIKDEIQEKFIQMKEFITKSVLKGQNVVSDENMKRIISLLEVDKYQRGNLILQKGDELDDLLIIKQGEVLIKHLCLIGVGQLLGEIDILQNIGFQYYAYCQTGLVEVYRLNKDVFSGLLREFKQVRNIYMQSLYDKQQFYADILQCQQTRHNVSSPKYRSKNSWVANISQITNSINQINRTRSSIQTNPGGSININSNGNSNTINNSNNKRMMKKVLKSEQKWGLQIDRFSKSKTLKILKDISMMKNRDKNVETLTENNYYGERDIGEIIDKKVKDEFEKMYQVRVQKRMNDCEKVECRQRMMQIGNQMVNSNRCLIRQKQGVLSNQLDNKNQGDQQKQQLIDRINNNFRQNHIDINNKNLIFDSVRWKSNDSRKIEENRKVEKNQIHADSLKKEMEARQSGKRYREDRKQQSMDWSSNRTKQTWTSMQIQCDMDDLCIDNKNNLIRVKYSVKKNRHQRMFSKQDVSNFDEQMLRETYSSLMKNTLNTEYIETDQDRQHSNVFKAVNNQFDNLETVKTENVRTENVKTLETFRVDDVKRQQKKEVEDSWRQLRKDEQKYKRL